MKNVVMFDLDGTLIDSSKDIIRLLIKAIRLSGFDISDDVKIPIGPPLEEMIKSLINNISDEDISNIVNCFRSLYKVEGVVDTTVYSGMIDFLKELKTNGCKVFIVTFKPKNLCDAITSKFFVGLYDDIVTPTDIVDFKKRKSKVDMYKLLQKKWNFSVDDCIMIGDAKSDVESANSYGICSIGVTYGYSAKEDLVAAKYLVENVKQLKEKINYIWRKNEK